MMSIMKTGRILALVSALALIAIFAAPVVADTLQPAGELNPFTKFFPVARFEPKAPSLQGFDRCTHPTPQQMQLWWLDSPYAVINLYIGGVHYPSACQTPAIDADWVQEVAAQGWSFTAVWVGLQAPCSNFLYPMKSDPAKAFNQGKNEAIAAVDAAADLGLPTDATLFYDIEGYPNESSCRNTVASFLEGWTQQLHDMGYKAGAYGSPCRSYIADWAANEPGLDEVWIAHWTDDTYNPLASVWDVPCNVPNSLWADNQRIKQYAGDHYETYGGVRLGIDSNVFDSSPITVTAPIPTMTGFVEDFGLLDETTGWVQSGNRLFWTDNLGLTWTDRAPANFALLSAGFFDASLGWVAGRHPDNNELQVGRTTDGGRTWSFIGLDPAGELTDVPIAAAWIEVLDPDTIWISIKEQSGSAFSIGRLFASSDGGLTWAMRSIPIGAPVQFSNGADGRTSGGPAGSETFRTADGGVSWQPAASKPSPTEATLANLPDHSVDVRQSGADAAWLLTQDGHCTGPKGAQVCTQEQALFYTVDGGENWLPISLP